MGIDISAGIVVGLPRKELEGHEKFDDFVNDGLEHFPPYYDGWEDAIFGYSIATTGDDSAIELGSLEDKIASAKALFKEETGLDAKAYLTPIVW